jgi:anaerobic ribonucleoside-triphosphate reductase
MDLINRAYIDVMMAGDAKGRVFTFPIPTYNITRRLRLGPAQRRALFEMTAKYGCRTSRTSSTRNCKPNMVRSMCCRLQLDLRELLKRGNGLFGSAEQTGSLGVVTINCARLGYLHQGDEAALLARTDELWSWARQPGDQAQADPAPHGQRACSPTPSATWARCATTSPRWA